MIKHHFAYSSFQTMILTFSILIKSIEISGDSIFFFTIFKGHAYFTVAKYQVDLTKSGELATLKWHTCQFTPIGV